jgi:hypothetical protein
MIIKVVELATIPPPNHLRSLMFHVFSLDAYMHYHEKLEDEQGSDDKGSYVVWTMRSKQIERKPAQRLSIIETYIQMLDQFFKSMSGSFQNTKRTEDDKRIRWTTTIPRFDGLLGVELNKRSPTGSANGPLTVKFKKYQ